MPDVVIITAHGRSLLRTGDFEWLCDNGCEEAMRFRDQDAEVRARCNLGGQCDDIHAPVPRDHPMLVELVRRGKRSDIQIVSVPDGINWCIIEHDGKEWVCDGDRLWGDMDDSDVVKWKACRAWYDEE